MKREPCWRESLAMGSAGFVEKIRPLILSRREMEIVETGGNSWALKEAGEDARTGNFMDGFFGYSRCMLTT